MYLFNSKFNNDEWILVCKITNKAERGFVPRNFVKILQKKGNFYKKKDKFDLSKKTNKSNSKPNSRPNSKPNSRPNSKPGSKRSSVNISDGTNSSANSSNTTSPRVYTPIKNQTNLKSKSTKASPIIKIRKTSKNNKNKRISIRAKSKISKSQVNTPTRMINFNKEEIDQYNIALSDLQDSDSDSEGNEESSNENILGTIDDVVEEDDDEEIIPPVVEEVKPIVKKKKIRLRLKPNKKYYKQKQDKTFLDNLTKNLSRVQSNNLIKLKEKKELQQEQLRKFNEKKLEEKRIKDLENKELKEDNDNLKVEREEITAKELIENELNQMLKEEEDELNGISDKKIENLAKSRTVRKKNSLLKKESWLSFMKTNDPNEVKKPKKSKERWLSFLKEVNPDDLPKENSSIFEKKKKSNLLSKLNKTIKSFKKDNNLTDNLTRKKLNLIKSKELIKNKMHSFLVNRKFKLYLKKSKEFKKSRIRYKLIQEIYETEFDYVKILKIIVYLFISPITQKKLIKSKDIEIIFGYIENLLGVHQALLNAMEEQLNKPVILMGNVFITMAHFLRVYPKYINQYDEAMNLLRTLTESKSKFAKFLEKQSTIEECNNLCLQDFLIAPVQRIPRYRLLLRDLIKVTPEEHVDFKNLNKSLDLIMEIATFVNEQKREAENEKKVNTLQEILSDEPKLFSHIFKENRKFLIKFNLKMEKLEEENEENEKDEHVEDDLNSSNGSIDIKNNSNDDLNLKEFHDNELKKSESKISTVEIINTNLNSTTTPTITTPRNNTILKTKVYNNNISLINYNNFKNDTFVGYLFNDLFLIYNENDYHENKDKKNYRPMIFLFYLIVSNIKLYYNKDDKKLSHFLFTSIHNSRILNYKIFLINEIDVIEKLFETFEENINTTKIEQCNKINIDDYKLSKMTQVRCEFGIKIPSLTKKNDLLFKKIETGEKKIIMISNKIEEHKLELKNLLELISREERMKDKFINFHDQSLVEKKSVEYELKLSKDIIQKHDEQLKIIMNNDIKSFNEVFSPETE